MVGIFICRKCRENSNGITNVCVSKNYSTAFGGNILKNMKCLHGYIPNWEYVTCYIDIPLGGFETITSQRELGIEANMIKQREDERKHEFQNGYKILTESEVDPEFKKFVERG